MDFSMGIMSAICRKTRKGRCLGSHIVNIAIFGEEVKGNKKRGRR